MLTADLDARDMFDMTAVHLAAENGHVESLHLLLDAGAGCNVATKYSRPGLYTGDIYCRIIIITAWAEMTRKWYPSHSLVLPQNCHIS